MGIIQKMKRGEEMSEKANRQRVSPDESFPKPPIGILDLRMDKFGTHGPSADTIQLCTRNRGDYRSMTDSVMNGLG